MAWLDCINIGFEPFVITALVMLAVVLVFGNRRLMLPVAALLVVMCQWRVLYGVHSGRYFVMIVAAMVLVVAVGAEKVEQLGAKYICGRSKYVIRALFGLLILVCCWKTFRVNTHQNFVIRISAALKADSGKAAAPILIDHSKGNALRMEYYAGMRSISGKYLPVVSPGAVDGISDEAANYRKLHDVVYIAVEENREDAENMARNGFIRIASSPRTRRAGRKVFSVYKYVPPAGDGAVPGAAVIDCDMTELRPAAVPKAIAEKRPGMLADPKILLPPGWSPNFGDGFAAETGAVLKPEAGWSGRALRLSGKKLITIFCPGQKFPLSQRHRVSFRYQARGLSRIRVKIYCYDDAGKMLGQFPVCAIKVNRMAAPEEFRCRVIRPDEVGSGYAVLAVCLDYGDVLLDDLKVYAGE